MQNCPSKWLQFQPFSGRAPVLFHSWMISTNIVVESYLCTYMKWQTSSMEFLFVIELLKAQVPAQKRIGRSTGTKNCQIKAIQK